MAIKVRVEHVPTDSITPSADNPRRHPRSQIRQLTKAIRELGFINPIIIDQDGIIVAGHARHHRRRPAVPLWWRLGRDRRRRRGDRRIRSVERGVDAFDSFAQRRVRRERADEATAIG